MNYPFKLELIYAHQRNLRKGHIRVTQHNDETNQPSDEQDSKKAPKF